ncbi:Os01g0838100 [Oryza sativa Japonica Group]|uniref:Os01g0838100 protein n=1 Tax=Oryza sativa subsp. japonica TaxID=39947 RepID=A0A0N7KE12_ORYSJ|nr:hypothetical protein EE612_006708 [Oryza sativa]BAS75129.1 Os01g0838100 [Oryza sativa Japonica Group]
MWFICIFESFLKCISVRLHVFFPFISIFFWRRCLLSRSGPCDTFVTVVLLFPLPSAPVQVADHIFCARTCRLSSYMEGGCVVRPARRRDRRLLERSSASLRSSSSNSAASEYVWETVAPPRQDDGFFPIYPAWYSSKRRQMRSKKLAMKRLVAAGKKPCRIAPVSCNKFDSDYAKFLRETSKDRCDYGPPEYRCRLCAAQFWYQERCKKDSAITKRRVCYNLCCKDGFRFAV